MPPSTSLPSTTAVTARATISRPGMRASPDASRTPEAQTRFQSSRTVYAPGRPDLIRDIDTVVANYFSLSYAAPRWLGSRRADFEADLRRLLYEHSPQGLFWDWPGDTELIMATKP